MGKSQILKAATKISDSAVMTVGYSTTAGLTAHAYKENGHYFVEGGALVRANNGVCCIDEINHMAKEHRNSFLEVMETQRITFAKGGAMIDLPTKVSIIAGMNAKNIAEPIKSNNLALDGSLLSRSDLIFAFESFNDDEFENAIMDHILGQSAAGSDFTPKWSLDRIKQHVLIAKAVQAEMTASAHKVLEQYYLFCIRKRELIEISRTTMRLWNSLIRLTICHAKLLLRSKVKIIDAFTVVMLMEQSWSFGCLLEQLRSIVTTTTPLGPSNEIIVKICDRLRLDNTIFEDTEEDVEMKALDSPRNPKFSTCTDNSDDNIFNTSGSAHANPNIADIADPLMHPAASSSSSPNNTVVAKPSDNEVSSATTNFIRNYYSAKGIFISPFAKFKSRSSPMSPPSTKLNTARSTEKLNFFQYKEHAQEVAAQCQSPGGSVSTESQVDKMEQDRKFVEEYDWSSPEGPAESGSTEIQVDKTEEDRKFVEEQHDWSAEDL